MITPPPGYRKLSPLDNFKDLEDQGRIANLCRCGHLLSEHSKVLGSCTRCPMERTRCRQYNWEAYVVKEVGQ